MVELLAASLPAAALYFWCRNSPLETMIPGVLQGPALSARALLAANYNRPAEETDAALSELERRGLVIVDESGAAPVLYLPEKLAELCSAPTTLKQIPGWVAQLRRLGALRARVQADALAVTARADEERAVRRKDGAQSLFDLLKEALGIALHPLPSAAAEQQLSLSLPAPLRAVPGPLAQSAEQRICNPQAEGSTPLGTSMSSQDDWLAFCGAAESTSPPAGKQPPAPPRGSPQARPKKLELLDVWNELRRLVPELAGERRYKERMSGEISTGLPGPLHHALVDGFLQTQQAEPAATLDDFRLLAEWVKRGGLHYLQSVEWCAHLCRSLPIVLEKAASWKAAGKPDPRSPAPPGAKPPAAQAQAGLRYHAPAQRWLTPKVREGAQKASAAAPQHIRNLLAFVGASPDKKEPT